MKINNSTAAAAAAPAFVSAMSAAATKADNQALTSTCAVLLLVRDSGGTNKKAAGALWALLPDAVVTTFQQVKRVNGAINAPSAKATKGANTIRPLWLAAKSGKAFVDALLDIGINSPRAMLDFVAPRKEPKSPAVKSAVESFLAAAKVEGFNEDITPLLVWITERHAKAMEGLLNQAQALQAGVLKDAAQKQADIDAKKAKAEKAKAAKAAKAVERSRLHAEKMAKIEQEASEAKSAQAKKAHEAKVVRERAMHPKVREIIEA